MRKHMSSIAGLVIGLGALGAWWSTRATVSGYNEYSDQLRPVVAEQDTIVQETGKASNADGAKKVDGWIETSKALEAKFVAITPKDPEIAAFHHHWINRAKSITAALEALKKFYGTSASADLEVVKKHSAEAKAHLDAFTAARNAYGKSNDIQFEQ